MPRIEALSDDVTVYLGDCLELFAELPTVQSVMTDPWYYPENQGTRNAFEDDAFWSITRRWVTACAGLVRPSSGHIFISFSTQKMAKFEYLLCELMLPLQSRVVWHYRNAGGRCADKSRFGKTYEMIYHLGFGNELNFPETWGDERFDVWTIAIPQANFKDTKIHPFQKPIELMTRLVQIGTRDGDLILDPFMGSGTTGVAAVKLGRKFIGIEIEPKHFDAACRRLSEALKRPELPMKQAAK